MKVTSVGKHFLTSPLQDGLNQLLHTQIKSERSLPSEVVSEGELLFHDYYPHGGHSY